MTAMFVEGVIFILITFLNIRELILNSIPMNLRYAISSGIGIFIAFIGLKNAGIIESNPATFVMFGAFTPSSVLAMVGILLSGILIVKKVKGALFYSILIYTTRGDGNTGGVPSCFHASFDGAYLLQIRFFRVLHVGYGSRDLYSIVHEYIRYGRDIGRFGFQDRDHGRRRTYPACERGDDV